MAKARSWEIYDEFWRRVKHLIPTRVRNEEVSYKRKAGGGRKPMDSWKVFV